ncbi:MAG TPA: hypothetical protein PK444_11315 [Syntrophorhabdaceae bacterium]|nr:hypothetical protein [Syntrophorhabdaceae bacterium]
MDMVDTSILKELYFLWRPVFPYLVSFIKEIYKREHGDIMEAGPFCGPLFSLKSERIGDRHVIATFPRGMGKFYRDEAIAKGHNDILVVESTDTFSCFKDSCFDLIIFRGGLFFPELFHVDYWRIYSLLKKGGIGLIGGGFGMYTPKEIIEGIKERSKELNLLAGKIDVSLRELEERIIPERLKGLIEVFAEGGLWTILRK